MEKDLHFRCQGEVSHLIRGFKRVLEELLLNPPPPTDVYAEERTLRLKINKAAIRNIPTGRIKTIRPIFFTEEARLIDFQS